MESKSFLQTLQSKSPLFKHVTSLDEVLCLATFKASGVYKEVDTVDDAREMWAQVFLGSCSECPFVKNCLACEINE
jgi:mono/diheme cytochrome c family protein